MAPAGRPWLWRQLELAGLTCTSDTQNAATDAVPRSSRSTAQCWDGTLPARGIIQKQRRHVTYARAMGPMQLCPHLPRRATDGDDDGVADPGRTLFDSRWSQPATCVAAQPARPGAGQAPRSCANN